MQTLNHLLQLIQASENEKCNNPSQESLSLSPLSLFLNFKENHLCFMAFRTINLLNEYLGSFPLHSFSLSFAIFFYCKRIKENGIKYKLINLIPIN